MKIEQFNVSMASQHAYARQVSRTETLNAWVGDERPDFEAMNRSGSNGAASATVAISDAARQAVVTAAQKQGSVTEQDQTEQVDGIEAASEDAVDDPKLNLLIRIIEFLTGKKITVMDAGDIAKISSANKELAKADPGQVTDPSQVSEQDTRQGWGVEYHYQEEIHEVEQTSFSASGEILTADGKRLQFDLTLQMSREYYQQSSFSFQAGDAVRKDPLVINFEGNAAQLTDQKFDFDIDADGQADRISFVGSASGFIALDKNANGRIDDGSELFGARTGDGFAELAAYDEDGNGWIDENDSIFAQLRIWTKDSNGADQLRTLAEHNVGALYLGQVATPFDMKDNQNNQHGQVLASGIYLSENGGAGTIQQLDLFV